MSNKSGVSEQVISLPKGGGALKGIGEKFSPDLHTGTGNFSGVPSQAVETYLNVTTHAQLDVHGAFKTVNVANERVTKTNSFSLRDLAPGTYYWKLFADGHGRRVASDLAKFEIH